MCRGHFAVVHRFVHGFSEKEYEHDPTNRSLTRSLPTIPRVIYCHQSFQIIVCVRAISCSSIPFWSSRSPSLLIHSFFHPSFGLQILCIWPDILKSELDTSMASLSRDSYWCTPDAFGQRPSTTSVQNVHRWRGVFCFTTWPSTTLIACRMAWSGEAGYHTTLPHRLQSSRHGYCALPFRAG